MKTLSTTQSLPDQDVVPPTPKSLGRRMGLRVTAGVVAGAGLLLGVGDTALAACENPSDYSYWSGGYLYDWDRQGLRGCIVNPNTGVGSCTNNYEVTVSYWTGNSGMQVAQHYFTTKTCTYSAK